MRIAYAKLGRSIPLGLKKASSVGGDAEVVRLLNKLRREHEVHIVGRNQVDVTLPNVVNHWAPGGIFDNVPYIRDEHRNDRFAFDEFYAAYKERILRLPPFDAWVIWLGQHGTSSMPLPKLQKGRFGNSGANSDSDYTMPLMSLLNYVGPLIYTLNVLKVRPIWLCPDPRNVLKDRTLADPNQRTILGQYNCHRDNKFYDAETGTLHERRVHLVYSGIELLAIDPDEAYLDEMPPEKSFGILVNEGYNNLGAKGRLALVKDWLKSWLTDPDFEFFGHWSASSQQALGRVITTVPLADVSKTLRRWRSTVTFPATATGWATTKPWECFATGCVCFKHPRYDDQRHIYGEHMPKTLRDFLCVPHATALRERVQALDDVTTWRQVAEQQFEYFHASVRRLDGGYVAVRSALEEVAREST